MRTVLFVCAAFLPAITSLAAYQDQKKKDDRSIITVTGCVDGNWLHVKKVFMAPGSRYLGSYAERYRLRGSRSLLKEMNEKFRDHLVEVVGAVRDTTPGTHHQGKVVQMGKKTTVYAGEKDVPDVPGSAPDPDLEVTSYKDLEPSCSK